MPWLVASWSDNSGNSNIKEHDDYKAAVADAEGRVETWLSIGGTLVEHKYSDIEDAEVWSILTGTFGMRYFGVWEGVIAEEHYVDAATRTGMYDYW